MIPIYAGFDPREEAGYHAFTSSVLQRASFPVSITPLHLPLFKSFYSAGQRDGSNAFIYTRFLIPFLQNFQGWALYCDGADMLMQADVAELWALRDLYKAVMVVKHNYRTRHPRKYLGTSMESPNENYPCKQWSSVMLINCNHFRWRNITPEAVEKMGGGELHRFAWIPDELIGELPVEWNWLADEYGENKDAKLLHWTAGSPGFLHYRNAPHAEAFRQQLRLVNYMVD